MGQVALPNGYGPGRRDELVDRHYSIDDGLGRELGPESLHLVGLSRIQLSDVANCMYEAAEEYQAFDFSAYQGVLESLLPGNRHHQWVMRVLNAGLVGWFDSLRELQPLSHAILTEPGSQLLSGFRRLFDNGPPNPGHHVMAMTVLVVRDRIIELVRYYTDCPEDDGVAGFENDALPEVLVRTWWYRTAGYRIVRSVPSSVYEWAQPLLQYPGAGGTGVNQLVQALGPKAKRTYMPLLKEQFGAEAVTKNFQCGKVALLCILDTRPPDTIASASGDQLFIHMARSDQTVYHVRACRFDQMKKINPAMLAECFDRYFAHVLGRSPGEFEFSPYLVPL